MIPNRASSVHVDRFPSSLATPIRRLRLKGSPSDRIASVTVSLFLLDAYRMGWGFSFDGDKQPAWTVWGGSLLRFACVNISALLGPRTTFHFRSLATTIFRLR